MNLCNDEHQEVCFEGNICPVCDVKSELQEAEDDLAKAEARINELESEL